LREAENRMDYTRRLATFEELKSLPWAAVWDYYCVQKEVPVSMAWYDAVRQYERRVLSQRGSPVAVPAR
jgi:L-rhamnose isomerase